MCTIDLSLSIYIFKPGPSEPWLDSEEKSEADLPTNQAKEKDLVPEENVRQSMIKLFYAIYDNHINL